MYREFDKNGIFLRFNEKLKINTIQPAKSSAPFRVTDGKSHSRGIQLEN